MIVVVCGDREWNDVSKIRERIQRITGNPTIITGGCRGADIIANAAADVFGFDSQSLSADWDKYGLSAGPIRNRIMLDMKPDLVIAFHSDIANSKGTKDCVFEANRRGIPVEIIP